jgi:hypothetical protein
MVLGRWAAVCISGAGAFPLQIQMASVVLLRGANLGSRRFSPKAVEAELRDLDAVSIGAAGTFVVRRPPARSTLLERIEAAVPFDPQAILVTGAQVRAAIVAGAKLEPPAGSKLFATAVEKVPKAPRVPLEEPEGKWGLRVVALEGPFALGFRRPVAVAGVYPNAVIEKAWGVRATTRDWATLEKVGKLLTGGNP